MKKILIYMKDSKYSHLLSNTLNSKYSDINSIVVKDIKNINDGLILTDIININKWNILLENENMKYQKIDNIYDLICRKYNNNLDIHETKIITFLNFKDNYAENKIVTNLCLEKSNIDKCLLINFNDFNKYYTNEEIGLETFLFSNNLDIDVNEYHNLHYISSTNLPLQTMKKENYNNIIDKLPKLKYKYIFIDLNFQINERNVEILNISNTIILLNFNNQDALLYKNYENFILKNYPNIKKIFLQTNNELFILKKEDFSIETKSAKEILSFIC